MASMSPELAQAIIASAKRLGVNPVDVGTAISYETGGRFSPSLWGGKNNDYLGLIQFGKDERAKYGVTPNQSAPEQMGAVENFLRDRGVKPGMGLMDIYSTINAGSPGHYNASDANNGGAPGTVADKVNYQMAGHKANVAAALGGPMDPTNPTDPTTTAADPGPAPLSLTAPVGALAGGDPNSTAALLQKLGTQLNGPAGQAGATPPAGPQFGPLQQIQMARPGGQSAALAAALAAHYGIGGANVPQA